MTASKTYKVECDCTNCGFSGTVEFEFGKQVLATATPCPNCGCLTLKRHTTPAPNIPDYEHWPWDHHPYKRYLSGDILPAIPMNQPAPLKPGEWRLTCATPMSGKSNLNGDVFV